MYVLQVHKTKHDKTVYLQSPNSYSRDVILLVHSYVPKANTQTIAINSSTLVLNRHNIMADYNCIRFVA